MSRPRRTHSSSLQLFPFLAVLVSALGALVLLLLAINRQVSLQASAAAANALIEQTNAEELALADRKRDLEQDLESLKRRFAEAQVEHGAVEQALAVRDRQLQLDGDRSEKLRRDLDRIRKARGETDEKIAALRQEIAAINRTKQQLGRRDPDRTFVPVVHPGANGTARQPIYLECNAGGIVFQPEAVAVPVWSFQSELGYAMLDRAVRFLLQYYGARDRQNGSTRWNGELEPYPLLLVRPDGVSLFYAARRVLENLDIPFGYELVESDWKFQFPEVDPRARAMLAASLELGPTNVAANGSNQETFNTSAGRRDTGLGRTALTPNLGRVLGLEPTAEVQPGSRESPSHAQPTPDPNVNGVGSGPTTAAGTGNSPHQWSPSGDGGVTGGTAAAGSGTKSHQRPQPGDGGFAGHAAGPGSSSRSGDNSVSADPAVRPRPFTYTVADNTAGRPASGVSGSSQARTTPAGTAEEHDTQETPRESTVLPSDRRSGVPAPRHVSTTKNEDDLLEEVGALAMPSSPGKVAIARNIEIDCRADTLHVRKRSVYNGMPDSNSLRNGMSSLVQELEREVVTWGPAGMTFRWQPKLLGIVHADGLEMYYGLRIAMIGTGMEIDHVLLMNDEFNWSDTLFLCELNLECDDSSPLF